MCIGATTVISSSKYFWKARAIGIKGGLKFCRKFWNPSKIIYETLGDEVWLWPTMSSNPKTQINTDFIPQSLISISPKPKLTTTKSYKKNKVEQQHQGRHGGGPWANHGIYEAIPTISFFPGIFFFFLSVNSGRRCRRSTSPIANPDASLFHHCPQHSLQEVRNRRSFSISDAFVWYCNLFLVWSWCLNCLLCRYNPEKEERCCDLCQSWEDSPNYGREDQSGVWWVPQGPCKSRDTRYDFSGDRLLCQGFCAHGSSLLQETRQ